MKYDVGDEVEIGSAIYKQKGIVRKATPPQPTYEIVTEDGKVFYTEEEHLTLLKRQCPHWRKALVVRAERGLNVDYDVTFDFCPNCGAPLTNKENT